MNMPTREEVARLALSVPQGPATYMALQALLELDDAARAVCEPCVPLDELARRVSAMRARLLRRGAAGTGK